MLDDEEAVEQLEGQRWHSEEVEGNDHLAVILEEGQPAPSGFFAADRYGTHGRAATTGKTRRWNRAQGGNRKPNPLSTRNVSTRLSDEGTFSFEGVTPDKYLLSVSGLPKAAYVKSVQIGDQEIVDSGLDLTGMRSNPTIRVLLGSQGATLEGTVREGEKPAQRSFVTLVPDPPGPERLLRLKTVFSTQEGRFLIEGVAPGEYALFAGENGLVDVLADPQFLRRFESNAVKVSGRGAGAQATEHDRHQGGWTSGAGEIRQSALNANVLDRTCGSGGDSSCEMHHPHAATRAELGRSPERKGHERGQRAPGQAGML